MISVNYIRRLFRTYFDILYPDGVYGDERLYTSERFDFIVYTLEKYKDLQKYETILRWEDERLYVESSFNGELLSITVELTNVFEDDLMMIKRYILKQSHQHKFETIEKSLKTLD
jgi:hypothetical protein